LAWRRSARLEGSGDGDGGPFFNPSEESAAKGLSADNSIPPSVEMRSFFRAMPFSTGSVGRLAAVEPNLRFRVAPLAQVMPQFGRRFAGGDIKSLQGISDGTLLFAENDPEVVADMVPLLPAQRFVALSFHFFRLRTDSSA
jgi:hypothetical protein